MRVVNFVCLFFIVVALASAQDEGGFARGSIPEELLRPVRGETPRFPIDTVIGGLGQGEASAAAYSFAGSLAGGFISGDAEHSGLATVSRALREDYLSRLGAIQPDSFRLGSGREEADGSVSFLIRFLGREQAITGEVFIRYITREIEELVGDEVNIRTVGSWRFEDLILEGARSREVEHREALRHFDFSPYERFF